MQIHRLNVFAPFSRGAGGRITRDHKAFSKHAVQGEPGRRIYIKCADQTVDKSTLLTTLVCGLPGRLFRAQKAFSSAEANPEQINEDVCTLLPRHATGLTIITSFDGQEHGGRAGMQRRQGSALFAAGVFLGHERGRNALFCAADRHFTCLTAGERLRANLVARNPDASYL